MGVMAWAVAPKLFCEGFNFGIVSWETIARNCESLLKKNICCGILEEVMFTHFVVEVQEYEFRTI